MLSKQNLDERRSRRTIPTSSIDPTCYFDDRCSDDVRRGCAKWLEDLLFVDANLRRERNDLENETNNEDMHEERRRQLTRACFDEQKTAYCTVLDGATVAVEDICWLFDMFDDAFKSCRPSDVRLDFASINGSGISQLSAWQSPTLRIPFFTGRSENRSFLIEKRDVQ